MYTLCICNTRYFSAEVGQVVTMLLALGTCSQSSTGKNIFLLLDKELKDRNIPWQNSLAYCSDNASVMMGGKKGVKAFIEKEVASVITIGCPCHLIHLAAGKAAGQLSVDVEGLLIDVYYYMEKSTKRDQELKKCQVLCDVTTHKVLKHVSTRWLSLGTCIDRLLEQMPALQQYVVNTAPKPKKVSWYC